MSAFDACVRELLFSTLLPSQDLEGQLADRIRDPQARARMMDFIRSGSIAQRVGHSQHAQAILKDAH
eukprot:5319677-Alexandrium_andersonii.AAC.1